MEIKFSCSNSDCRQRISVDESKLGQWIRCPACSAEIRVPSSKSIRFNCSNPDCGQHLLADISESGRFMRCPSCKKVQQIAGYPPKSADPKALSPESPLACFATAGISHFSSLNAFQRLLVGWGIGVMICGFVFGWLAFRKEMTLPRHLESILEETYFHGEIVTAPAENNAGTALIYARTIEKGIGIFKVDLDTLARTQIAAGGSSYNDRGKSARLFGWSPDDRYLAFSTIEKNDENRRVSICDGQSAKIVDAFEAPGSLLSGGWLDNNSLFLFDNSRKLYLYNLDENRQFGNFGAKGLVSLSELATGAGSLVQDSDHSIAYIEGGNLWTLSVGARSALQLTHLEKFSISGGLSYCPATGKYLFSVTNGDSEQPILCQFDPRAGSSPVSPIDGCGNYQFKGQWIGNGDGVAYVGLDGNRYCVGIVTGDSAFHTNLFTAPPFDPDHGFVNQNVFPEGKQVVRSISVSPKGDKIYVVASIEYKPLSIWEYNIASRELRDIVPINEKRVYSHFVEPVQASITSSNGKTITYYYLPAARANPGKKYPAVIDTYSDLGFQPNSEFLANSGIYYVTVNPYGQGFPKSATTPEDALAVYKEILKNPNVDPKRIYLSGESLGTKTIASLLGQDPDIWRGAILLSPITFQPVSRDTKMVKSIFCSFGTEDDRKIREQMEQYAQMACAHHTYVQVLYGHAGHAFFDIQEHKNRYKGVATFILEDR